MQIPKRMNTGTSKRMTSLRTVAETLSKSRSYCVTLASHCFQRYKSKTSLKPNTMLHKQSLCSKSYGVINIKLRMNQGSEKLKLLQRCFQTWRGLIKRGFQPHPSYFYLVVFGPCRTSAISSLASCSLSGLLAHRSLASVSLFFCSMDWASCQRCHAFIRWSKDPCRSQNSHHSPSCTCFLTFNNIGHFTSYGEKNT